LKTFVSIYRDKDGSTFVGEMVETDRVEELVDAEQAVLEDIPTLVSVDICEVYTSLHKETFAA